MSLSRCLLAALVLAPLSLLQAAELRLASVFTDAAVLQRGQPVPVWGWAEPGESVTVEFAGQSKTAQADSSGQWVARLDPLAASATGRDLVARSGDTKARIGNVLVGDVWLCSGQSNMNFQMRSDADASREIPASANPSLRFFTVVQAFGQSPLKDVKGSWKQVSPETTASCSAVAYYFGKHLQRHQDVPVGLLISTVGGTRIETWMRPETLAATGESKALVEKWAAVSPAEFQSIGAAYAAYQKERDQGHPQAVKEAKAKGETPPPPPVSPKLRCHDSPSALHYGMIAPLEPYGLRGAIWYQGEANVGQPGPYQKLLPALIADWRKTWGAEMPFFLVQLAPHKGSNPAFREAQFRITQATPLTGLAVTTDVGDADNIHPTRKGPVGERLALAARALTYGEKVVYSGPVFQAMKTEGARAVLSFTHTGSGLVAKEGELKGFTIAGPDGKFVPAQAVIEGGTVVVSAAKVTKPSAVRFGWDPVPDVNLFNREGLPAVPFRTDAPAK